MIDALVAGLKKLLMSRKFLTSVIGTIILGLAVAFNVPPAVLDAVKWLLLALIATWTFEDVAASFADALAIRFAEGVKSKKAK